MEIQYRTNRTKIIIAISLVIVLVAGAVFGVYVYTHRNNDNSKRDTSGVSTERTPQDIKLEEDLKSNSNKKEQSTQTDRPAAPTVDKTTNLQQVNVVLTNTGQNGNTVSASGFVSNVVEANGICKYVFSHGQATIEKKSTTLTNPSSTTCKTVSFDKSELTTGVWKVHIEYNSSVSTGKSNELEVTIT